MGRARCFGFSETGKEAAPVGFPLGFLSRHAKKTQPGLLTEASLAAGFGAP